MGSLVARSWRPQIRVVGAAIRASSADGIAGIPNCVAYGPGILDLAHQPDEWCGIEDLVNSTKVLALSILELTGTDA